MSDKEGIEKQIESLLGNGTITPDNSQELYNNQLNIYNSSLDKIVLKDHDWRVRARSVYGDAFMVLLFVQNAIVFGIIVLAFFMGELKDLSLILGIVLTGTLGETYFVIRVIVQWIFSNINYENIYHKPTNKD